MEQKDRVVGFAHVGRTGTGGGRTAAMVTVAHENQLLEDAN